MWYDTIAILDIATSLSLNTLFGSRHQGQTKASHPSLLPAWHAIDSCCIAWYWPILDIACSAHEPDVYTHDQEATMEIGVPGVIRGKFSVRQRATKSPSVAMHDYIRKNNTLCCM